MQDKVSPDVVLVTPVPVPEGGAAARRILGIAASLEERNVAYQIASGGMVDPSIARSDTVRLSERNADHLPSALKRISYFTIGRRTMAWLDSLPKPPRAIVLYSGYVPYLLRLMPWCQKHGVRLIFDAVEWYGKGLKESWKSPYLWQIELAMRALIPRCDGVIAISDYLSEYYSARETSVFQMPPTLDVEARDASFRPTDRLELGYTGFPGAKERIAPILDAVERIDPEGRRVRLRLAGLSPDDLGRSRILQTVQALGTVSGEEARNLSAQCDFTFVLRDPHRVNIAGFPTKLAESMAAGTPVIATPVGSVESHLADGVTGLACRDTSPREVESAIRRAIAISPREREKMRQATRTHALGAFDFRNYAEGLENFLLNGGS